MLPRAQQDRTAAVRSARASAHSPTRRKPFPDPGPADLAAYSVAHPLSKVVSLRAPIHAMLIALEMTRVTRASEMRDSATIRAWPTA
jgi:hypothetical protein